MDLGHMFQIGDVVRIKGTAPDARVRFLVFEQHVQQCYGGVQASYFCTAIRSDGPVNPSEIVRLIESQVEASEAFKVREPVSMSYRDWDDVSGKLKDLK